MSRPVDPGGFRQLPGQPAEERPVDDGPKRDTKSSHWQEKPGQSVDDPDFAAELIKRDQHHMNGDKKEPKA